MKSMLTCYSWYFEVHEAHLMSLTFLCRSARLQKSELRSRSRERSVPSPTMFRDVRLSSCNYSARAFKDEWKFMSGDNQRDRTKKLKACTSKLLMPTQLNHQLFYHMLLSIRWYPWWLVDWLASSSVSSSSSSSLIWTIGLYLTICQAQQPVTAMEELLTNCAWQGFKGELGSQLLKVGELESDDSRMQRLLSFLQDVPTKRDDQVWDMTQSLQHDTNSCWNGSFPKIESNWGTLKVLWGHSLKAPAKVCERWLRWSCCNSPSIRPALSDEIRSIQWSDCIETSLICSQLTEGELTEPKSSCSLPKKTLQQRPWKDINSLAWRWREVT